MSILDKVLSRPGIEPVKIINEFSKDQIDEIYPALSPQIMVPLIEELELMQYLNTEDGRTMVTEKGEKKLENYKSSLSGEERDVLGM
jgi:hypothetical protein